MSPPTACGDLQIQSTPDAQIYGQKGRASPAPARYIKNTFLMSVKKKVSSRDNLQTNDENEKAVAPTTNPFPDL